ncbi:hypothetical protein CGSSp14BS69_00120 [Streptococcus pneumoniae SP14-BS69]|nr:hypothetical protein CGSSp14BS69_00120 [Streptococcus pneumoniae SP14-BS69]
MTEYVFSEEELAKNQSHQGY